MREIYELEPSPDRWWEVFAACTSDGVDVEAFMSPGRESAAVAICGTCIVKDECGAYAEANDEQFGIWGGVQRGPILS